MICSAVSRDVALQSLSERIVLTASCALFMYMQNVVAMLWPLVLNSKPIFTYEEKEKE